MKERPMLFSAPMVRAILSDQKTQTRRIVKPQTKIDPRRIPDGFCSLKCPYGDPGDRLWVRESHCKPVMGDCRNSESPARSWPVLYRADVGQVLHRDMSGFTLQDSDFKWRPSIHMPRVVSRLTLEIMDIGIERLNELTTEDAIKEGCRFAGFPASLTDVGAFAKLWEQINGKGSWAANPYVWVVSFRRIK